MKSNLLFTEEQPLIGFQPKGFLKGAGRLFHIKSFSIIDRLHLVTLDKSGHIKSLKKPSPAMLYRLKRMKIEFTGTKDDKGYYRVILHKFIDEELGEHSKNQKRKN